MTGSANGRIKEKAALPCSLVLMTTASRAPTTRTPTFSAKPMGRADAIDTHITVWAGMGFDPNAFVLRYAG